MVKTLNDTLMVEMRRANARLAICQLKKTPEMSRVSPELGGEPLDQVLSHSQACVARVILEESRTETIDVSQKTPNTWSFDATCELTGQTGKVELIIKEEVSKSVDSRRD
jgi:hypothetical protein